VKDGMHIKERSVLCLMLLRRDGSGCCLEAVKLNYGWLGLVGVKSNERITIGSWGRCPNTVMQHSINTLMTIITYPTTLIFRTPFPDIKISRSKLHD